MLPRLFTKFASKSFKGTGLGLFMAAKYGGENNVDGVGATFSFSLPAS